MQNVSRYRALASLYRQHAAHDPDKSWYLLGQAERWEHLADQEISDRFEECRSASALQQDVSDLAA